MKRGAVQSPCLKAGGSSAVATSKCFAFPEPRLTALAAWIRQDDGAARTCRGLSVSSSAAVG